MEIKALEELGVSPLVIEKLSQLGYERLTEIQQLAIENGLFDKSNLLVSAPTNTGKTFIGELAAVVASKTSQVTRVFYLVPLKSLGEEKFLEFKSKYEDWGLSIAISTADRTEMDDNLREFQLVIATYEKLSALIVRDKSILNDIGVVVIDEIQNLNDSMRGAGLEILLTMLTRSTKEHKPQVIGLSATIPNPDELAKWMGAKLISVKKRAVELQEGVQYNGDKPFVFKGKSIKKGTFLYREHNTGSIAAAELTPMNLVSTFDELAKSQQILVFAPTRWQAEDIAIAVAKGVSAGDKVTSWISDLDTKVETTPSTRQLKTCMLKGVAFHHAGLLAEERNVVEQAFGAGAVRVVVSTSTLGAGINTPAKTVIILPNKYVKVADYKNMAGRAGRIKFHDDYGRSVLFSDTPKEFESQWVSYVDAVPERITTQIPKADLDLQLIGLMSSGIADSDASVLGFLKETLFGFIYYESGAPEFKGAFDKDVRNRLSRLVKEDFLKLEDSKFKVTEFGKRTAWHLFPPGMALLIRKSLGTLKEKGELLKDHDRLVEALVNTGCVVFAGMGEYNALRVTSQQEEKELLAYLEYNKDSYLLSASDAALTLRALKTTQMLMRWINGEEYSELRKFAQQGIVRRIAQQISWIMKGMLDIAKKPLFEFDEMALRTIGEVGDRLFYGIPANSLSVARLGVPGIGRGRAIKLAKAGYTNMQSLVDAEPASLASVEDIPANVATELVKSIEHRIESINQRTWKSQKRRAKELGRETTLIDGLYTKKDDNFSVACASAFKEGMGINCSFVGNLGEHEPDLLFEEGEKFVAECKCIHKGLVSAKESEEILGKGKKYNPACYITFGYPDFSDEARKNCPHTRISLLTHRWIGETLLSVWAGTINKAGVISLLKSGKYEGKEQPEVNIMDF